MLVKPCSLILVFISASGRSLSYFKIDTNPILDLNQLQASVDAV